MDPRPVLTAVPQSARLEAVRVGVMAGGRATGKKVIGIQQSLGLLSTSQ